MNKQILVVGSVALDILFPIQGDMRKEIPLKNGKVSKVNLTFLAEKSHYYYGGTAGNICYGLGLLGFKPTLFSAVGEDFNQDYKTHLEKHGVICRPIVGSQKTETAKSFQISDEHHQQITIFQANYYGERLDNMSLFETLKKDNLKKFAIAIFSPGNNKSTLNTMLEFRKVNRKATVIFDPGMNVTSFTKENMQECISHSDILISNDVEIARIKSFHKLNKEQLIKLGLKYVIETKGEDGSVIHNNNESIKVPAVKPSKIVETTGAGDAYRAGMIAGLVENKPIVTACKQGAKVGALCVEEYGGQGYSLK